MDKTIRQTIKIKHQLVIEAALFGLAWYLWLLILNALTGGYVGQIMPIAWFGWLAGSLVVLALIVTRQKPF